MGVEHAAVMLDQPLEGVAATACGFNQALVLAGAGAWDPCSRSTARSTGLQP
jgi:hypothetical protein